MPVERLVVLASSKKLAARCVAGISLQTGQWVRPVSSVNGGALSIADCGVQGRYPRPLEIVTFETLRACPRPHQPENVLIPRRPWTLESRIDRPGAERLLQSHLERGPTLLGFTGRAIDEQACVDAPLRSSLAIVESQGLSLENERVTWGDGSRQWVHFELAGASHSLPLTDFVIGPRLKRKPFGRYALSELDLPPIRRWIVTVSLGEAYNGVHYKLAAAVFGIGRP